MLSGPVSLPIRLPRVRVQLYFANLVLHGIDDKPVGTLFEVAKRWVANPNVVDAARRRAFVNTGTMIEFEVLLKAGRSQPPRPLSILFLATEIVHGREGRAGLTERYPWRPSRLACSMASASPVR